MTEKTFKFTDEELFGIGETDLGERIPSSDSQFVTFSDEELFGASQPVEPEPEEQGLLETAGDALHYGGYNAIGALGSAGEFLGDVTGIDTLSELGQSASEFAEEGMSNPEIAPPENYRNQDFWEAFKEKPLETTVVGVGHNLPLTAGLLVPGLGTAGIAARAGATGATIAKAATAASLPGVFGVEGGEAYKRGIQEGATREQAIQAGLGAGAINTALEVIPLGAIFANPAGRSAMKQIGDIILKEAGTEALQEFNQNAQAMLAYDPEMTVGELFDNVGAAAYLGGVSGGLIGGAKVMIDQRTGEVVTPPDAPLDEETGEPLALTFEPNDQLRVMPDGSVMDPRELHAEADRLERAGRTEEAIRIRAIAEGRGAVPAVADHPKNISDKEREAMKPRSLTFEPHEPLRVMPDGSVFDPNELHASANELEGIDPRSDKLRNRAIDIRSLAEGKGSSPAVTALPPNIPLDERVALDTEAAYNQLEAERDAQRATELSAIQRETLAKQADEAVELSQAEPSRQVADKVKKLKGKPAAEIPAEEPSTTMAAAFKNAQLLKGRKKSQKQKLVKDAPAPEVKQESWEAIEPVDLVETEAAPADPEKVRTARMGSERHRSALQVMANELTPGGDISLVQDEQGDFIGRTKSINPKWFQALAAEAETKTTVKNLQNTINKALEGKRLGNKQKRIVDAMLDIYEEQYAEDQRIVREQNQAEWDKIHEEIIAEKAPKPQEVLDNLDVMRRAKPVLGNAFIEDRIERLSIQHENATDKEFVRIVRDDLEKEIQKAANSPKLKRSARPEQRSRETVRESNQQEKQTEEKVEEPKQKAEEPKQKAEEPKPSFSPAAQEYIKENDLESQVSKFTFEEASKIIDELVEIGEFIEQAELDGLQTALHGTPEQIKASDQRIYRLKQEKQKLRYRLEDPDAYKEYVRREEQRRRDDLTKDISYVEEITDDQIPDNYRSQNGVPGDLVFRENLRRSQLTRTIRSRSAEGLAEAQAELDEFNKLETKFTRAINSDKKLSKDDTNDIYVYLQSLDIPFLKAKQRAKELFGPRLYTRKKSASSKSKKEVGPYRFSLAEAPVKKGISKAAIDRRINTIVKDWKNVPDEFIMAKQTEAELPVKILEKVYATDSQGKVQGVFDADTNQIWLVADNLASIQEAEETFFHEAYGHLGSRTIASPEELDSFFRFLAKRFPKDAGRIRQDYSVVDQETGTKIPPNIHEVGDEIFAYYAQHKPATRLFDEIIRKIRSWIRRNFKSDLNYSDREIRAMLGAARKGVKEGNFNVTPLAPKTGDVRFSIAKADNIRPSDKPFLMPEDGRVGRLGQRAIFKFQDKMNSLAHIQKQIEATKGKLSDSENAYVEETRYHGTVAARFNDFNQDHLEPLIEEIAQEGLSLEQIEEYLHARHAPEANKHLKSINPDVENNEALSGMSDKDAAAVMARAQKDGTAEKLEKVAARLDNIIELNRKNMVEYGLIDQQEVDNWTSKYEYYVPLYREGFDTGLQPRGSGFAAAGGPKSRVGSARAVDNIFAHIIENYENTIYRGEKAKVGRALYNLAKNNPNEQLWKVDKVQRKKGVGRDGMVSYVSDPNYRFQDNVLPVIIDGAVHTIEFNASNYHGQKIVYAMKNMGSSNNGVLVRAGLWVNRILSNVNTSLNPEFIISNLVRDLQTAFYNISGTEADKLKYKVLKDVRNAWSGIRQHQKGKMDGAWAKRFRQFRDAGGQTGWTDNYKDIDERADKLRQMLNTAQKNPVGAMRRTLKGLAEFISDENIAVENAVRLSAFHHAMEAGMSEAQAAFLAKELTVNFNRKGDIGPALNAMYLFYNASIQGTMRMFKAARHSRKVQGFVASTVLFAALLDNFNRTIGGEDEDGRAKYDKIPDYVKDRNLIVMTGGDDFIKIPLPWGYNVFHVLGQEIGRGMLSGDPLYDPAEGATRFMGAAIDAFNPVGGAQSLLQVVAPTIVDPFVQWSENQDWAGRPLRPEDSPYDVPTADSQKYWSSVRPWSKWIAQQVNEATGGNEVKPGALDFSPEALDLFIDTVTGGMGRFIADAFATPYTALKGEEVIESYQIPGYRKVAGNISPKRHVNDFYDYVNSIRLVELQLKFYRDDRPKYRSLREENKAEASLIRTATTYKNAVRKINKKIRNLRKSTLSDEVKNKRISSLEEQRNRIALRFNKMYLSRVQ